MSDKRITELDETTSLGENHYMAVDEENGETNKLKTREFLGAATPFFVRNGRLYCRVLKED